MEYALILTETELLGLIRELSPSSTTVAKAKEILKAKDTKQ